MLPTTAGTATIFLAPTFKGRHTSPSSNRHRTPTGRRRSVGSHLARYRTHPACSRLQNHTDRSMLRVLSSSCNYHWWILIYLIPIPTWGEECTNHVWNPTSNIYLTETKFPRLRNCRPNHSYNSPSDTSELTMTANPVLVDGGLRPQYQLKYRIMIIRKLLLLSSLRKPPSR